MNRRRSSLRAWRLGLCVLTTLLAAGCSPDGPERDVPAGPVVVYAGYEDGEYLPALFEAYTEATGVTVIVRQGDGAALIDDVIDKQVAPPADVVVSRSLRGVSRAADEGALRPLPADLDYGGVPEWLRDPDRYWAGIAMRIPIIIISGKPLPAPAPGDWTDLADPAFAGELCLSSSQRFVNRTVIAMLIDASGIRAAELTVRGWIANLALPVLADDAAVLAAIANGDCAVGIVSYGPYMESAYAGVRRSFGHALFADVEAAGIARHARNPEGAAALIEWLLSDAVQDRHGRATRQFAASEHVGYRGTDYETERGLVSAAGVLPVVRWDEEAIRLAERARYP